MQTRTTDSRKGKGGFPAHLFPKKQGDSGDTVVETDVDYSLDVRYIGIDPGASGGLAYVSKRGKVKAVAMPSTFKDILDTLKEFKEDYGRVVCVIEKVQGYIGGPQPGSAMFKFGKSAGALEMALIALDIPFVDVVPQKWQKEFGLHRAKTEKKPAFKARMRAKAQSRFPSETVTLKTADALLLAEYCRRNSNLFH